MKPIVAGVSGIVMIQASFNFFMCLENKRKLADIQNKSRIVSDSLARSERARMLTNDYAERILDADRACPGEVEE